MKQKTIFYITTILVAASVFSCVTSELSWSARAGHPNPLRQLVGLPSDAVGNLNPVTRNPGLELYCTSLYDMPGGFCTYFAPGLPSIDYSTIKNATVSDYP